MTGPLSNRDTRRENYDNCYENGSRVTELQKLLPRWRRGDNTGTRVKVRRTPGSSRYWQVLTIASSTLRPGLLGDTFKSREDALKYCQENKLTVVENERATPTPRVIDKNEKRKLVPRDPDWKLR